MIIWMLYLLLCAPSGPATVATQAPQSADGLIPAERVQLAKEQKVDRRIKIYAQALARHRASFEGAVIKQDYEAVAGVLASWFQLLQYSVDDIDSGITNRKNKSKELIRYEIQLRKAISDVQGYRTTLPVDQVDALDTWLSRAEEAHQKIVEILFPR
jgi:hypothetical protein